MKTNSQKPKAKGQKPTANLCIIPARGGSKRIPRKNIKDFLGKPIIAYSIETTIKSELFDTVMVSTDDKEIAEVAKKYGAKVPFFRSKKNADDYATLPDVLIEVYQNLKQKLNISFDNICCILPTAPLITVQRIKEGYELLINSEVTSVVPVIAFSYPVWRSFRINDQNRLEMIWPEYLKSRSQDLPVVYHDAGSFYWIKRGSFFKEKNLFTSKSQPLILEETEVQDIDTLEDWRLAELKYKYLHEKE
jgi:N-acylneuraminate cytidylyltransferase